MEGSFEKALVAEQARLEREIRDRQVELTGIKTLIATRNNGRFMQPEQANGTARRQRTFVRRRVPATTAPQVLAEIRKSPGISRLALSRILRASDQSIYQKISDLKREGRITAKKIGLKAHYWPTEQTPAQ